MRMFEPGLIAAKLGVAPNLRGRQHLEREQMVFEMRPPQRRMRGADRIRGGRQAGRSDRLAGELSVQVRFLRNQLLAERNRLGLHGRE